MSGPLNHALTRPYLIKSIWGQNGLHILEFQLKAKILIWKFKIFQTSILENRGLFFKGSNLFSKIFKIFELGSDLK